MKFPKINTLYYRDKLSGLIDQSILCMPEFRLIDRYTPLEKVDGMNIRVEWDLSRSKNPQFFGRTDDAIISEELREHLRSIFPWQRFDLLFQNKKVTLFGEGFGRGIHSGGDYSLTQKFILFAAVVDGWWLEYVSLKEIAREFKIPIVAHLGLNENSMTKEEIIELVKSEPYSKINGATKKIEGVVAISYPMVLFRNGTPVMFKLKCKDFKDLENKKHTY